MRFASDNVDYLAQKPDVVQRLFLHYRFYWFFRTWQPDDVCRVIEDTFDQLVAFSTSNQALMAMRQLAVSLTMNGGGDIDGTLVYAAIHSVAMADVHAHLHANDRETDNAADRWNLFPVATDGGMDITHEVVVIDNDGLDDRWRLPEAAEDEDDDAWLPTFDDYPVVTNYRGEDQRVADEAAFDAWCRCIEAGLEDY
jgi:hypothetical protein